jgi:transcriptional regulator with XRE-family HTH domain
LYDFANMNDVKIQFGLKVKQLRISKGYSQEKLAELADLDRTYIPGIENGKRNVSIVVMQKIASAFKITMAELLSDI